MHVMVHATSDPEPKVPVLVPEPAPVPPELPAGTMPEIVPWNWGDATADVQLPAGPTRLMLASDITNVVELGVHWPLTVTSHRPVVDTSVFLTITIPVGDGVALDVVTHVFVARCAVRVDAVDVAGSTSSEPRASITLAATMTRRRDSFFITTPLQMAPDGFRRTKRRARSRAVYEGPNGWCES